MAVSAESIKELRTLTGAGVLDCKRALEETDGNFDQAVEVLRQKGLAAAAKKATREANEGLIGSYVHMGAKVAALVEINCETDFVAKTAEFQQLVRDLAMQVAAAHPRYVRREDVSAEQIESALYSAYGDRQVSTIYAPNNQYKVILELDEHFQRDPSALALLRVRSAQG